MQEIEYSAVKEQKLAFRCIYSHQRLAAIMAGLPEDELRESQNVAGKLEVSCNFCGEVYNFNMTELLRMK